MFGVPNVWYVGCVGSAAGVSIGRVVIVGFVYSVGSWVVVEASLLTV